MAKSTLIWFGGKGKVAKHIITKFPKHRVYVEPFGGAAHVIAQKDPVANEVYNDIDGNVVNFLLVLRDMPERLAQSCQSLPYSRELYEKWKREEMPLDPFEKAVRFFYLNRSGMSRGNGPGCAMTGWRHSISAGQNPAKGYLGACRRMNIFAERLRGVMIEHLDFRKVITKYDSSETLFYVDPPYVGRERFYAGGFAEKDHRDLAEILSQIKGKAIVSYYADPLVDEIYKGWQRETFQSLKQVINGGNCYAEEILLTNFDIEEAA
ncbi:DNA adenine methylase [Brevibacillus laterosporus]|uniref:DNA adenine methylase n=1 Tax=Brevibacillus laterosporus TaxID=1465 RepID=UPI0018F8A75F|nr:DNA adenine methylase [Brevibacillus laterosporus]MBG9774237.1 DNA methyltransferase [Brevibacillus laterosporus]